MKAPSPLGVYLYTNRISSERFAEMMSERLTDGTVSARTVEKWRAGTRVPNSINMRIIKGLTGITADQMLGDEV